VAVPRHVVPRDVVPRDVVPRDVVPRVVVPRDTVIPIKHPFSRPLFYVKCILLKSHLTDKRYEISSREDSFIVTDIYFQAS
jgi:hypothetical protein